jgi:hypothetical protein
VYVREVPNGDGGTTVWWFGVSQDLGQQWAYVFEGNRAAGSSYIRGTYIHVPLMTASYLSTGAVNLTFFDGNQFLQATSGVFPPVGDDCCLDKLWP